MSFKFYLKGQQALQKITGEEEIAVRRIPMLREELHPKSVRFIEDQIFAFLGSEDAIGDLWLSLLVGERGFINIPSLHEIRIDLSRLLTTREDIFHKNIKTNPTVGLLFHEAIRRSRYRAWGMATEVEGHLSFAIRMGYPSCPRHIQKEEIELSESAESTPPAKHEDGTALGQFEKDWITNAHTFFITTQTENGDIESSHRGGDPGFVEILEDGKLRVPDYFGNSIYSTLGNIYVNPKAALLFVDYEKGETLQVTGTAALQFDQNSESDYYKSGETGRFWTFEAKRWIRTINHHKVNAAFVEFSKWNVITKKEGK